MWPGQTLESVARSLPPLVVVSSLSISSWPPDPQDFRGLPVWPPQPSTQAPSLPFFCLVLVSKFLCHQLPGGCGFYYFFKNLSYLVSCTKSIGSRNDKSLPFPFYFRKLWGGWSSLAVCTHRGCLLPSSWLVFVFQNPEQGEGLGTVHASALIRAIAFSRHLEA